MDGSGYSRQIGMDFGRRNYGAIEHIHVIWKMYSPIVKSISDDVFHFIVVLQSHHHLSVFVLQVIVEFFRGKSPGLIIRVILQLQILLPASLSINNVGHAEHSHNVRARDAVSTL